MEESPSRGQAASSARQLRRQAEQIIKDGLPDVNFGGDDARIVHELQVHRIELEIQNEELQASRDELERARQHYAELYDFAPVGYLTLKRDGTIVESNQAAAELVGVEPTRLRGRWFGDFVTSTDLPTLVVLLERVFASPPAPHSCEVSLSGGHVVVDLRVTVGARDDECRLAAIDVTARRREADLRQQLAEVRQREQDRYLDSLGRLAGGVAHEFNNKLTVILGNAEVVLDRPNLLDPVYGRVLDIRLAAQSCERLTRQLLGFAGKQMISRETLEPNKIIRGMLPMLRNMLNDGVELGCRLQAEVWPVEMDPAQLEQIVMNLALHAADALPADGTVTLETTNVTCDETWMESNVPFQRGDYVCLLVSDNGKGMDAEQIAHLFEPFFKSLAPAEGLGMPSVYGIVKQNQGYVTVESVVGGGTHIAVYLPRTPEKVAGAASEGDASLRGTETILLVDDEEGILALCRATLEELGYTVLSARGGPEALAVATGHGGPIHLLLTGARAHGLEGRRLSEALGARRPAMVTVYTSHDVSDLTLPGIPTHQEFSLLRKPFAQSQMTRTIRAALDAAAGGATAK